MILSENYQIQEVLPRQNIALVFSRSCDDSALNMLDVVFQAYRLTVKLRRLEDPVYDKLSDRFCLCDKRQLSEINDFAATMIPFAIIADVQEPKKVVSSDSERPLNENEGLLLDLTTRAPEVSATFIEVLMGNVSACKDFIKALKR